MNSELSYLDKLKIILIKSKLSWYLRPQNGFELIVYSLHTNPVHYLLLPRQTEGCWMKRSQSKETFLQVSPLGLEIIHRTGSYTLSFMMKWPKNCQKSQMICNCWWIFLIFCRRGSNSCRKWNSSMEGLEKVLNSEN